MVIEILDDKYADTHQTAIEKPAPQMPNPEQNKLLKTAILRLHKNLIECQQNQETLSKQNRQL